MNKVLKIVAIFVLIGALGFAGYKLFFIEKEKDGSEIITAEDKSAEEDTQNNQATMPVVVLEVKRGALPLRLRISAAADVWEKAVLKSETQGKIQRIYHPIGTWVKKGQPLLKIDDTEVRLNLEKAQSTKLTALSKFLVKESEDLVVNSELSSKEKDGLAQLRKKYLKAADDFQKGRISRLNFDKIRDEYDTQQVFSGMLREEIRRAQEGLTNAILDLRQAEINLEKTVIRSPFEGVVSDLKVSTGERINAGQDVIRIVNLNTLYLKGSALESEYVNLKKEMAVRIKFDSFPDKYVYGAIQAISPEVDLDAKTIPVYVKVDNSERLFLPGMHAEIDIEYRVFDNVIKVPREAVIKRGDGDRPLCFVIKDNIADWRYVEVGQQNDEEYEIKSGIDEGDLVVVQGHLTLGHQSRVRIVNQL